MAPAVETLLNAHHLTRDDVIFVSHRGSDARRAAGSPATPGDSGNSVIGVVEASTVLRCETSTPSERLHAIRVAERTLRDLAADETDETVLDERWLRDAAIRLALSVNPVGLDAGGYAAALRQHVGSIPWPTGISPPTNLGVKLRAPTQWPDLDQRATASFAADTIHSVKGREYPGVVIVLPKKLLTDPNGRHVLDHWARDTASELRRILYVGASRAQRLLILAIHADHVDTVGRLLKDGNVPYELVLPIRSPAPGRRRRVAKAS